MKFGICVNNGLWCNRSKTDVSGSIYQVVKFLYTFRTWLKVLDAKFGICANSVELAKWLACTHNMVSRVLNTAAGGFVPECVAV